MGEAKKACPKCGKENVAYRSKLLGDVIAHYFRCSCDHIYVETGLAAHFTELEDPADWDEAS